MSTAKFVLAAAALALVCSGAVAADESKDRRGFNEMDRNADGKLTREEAAGNKELLAKWKEADANGDGVLTRGEYLDVMLAQDYNGVKQWLSGIFGGGASTGSSAEAKSASTGSSVEAKSASTGSTRETESKDRRGFNEMDKNADGKLTREEAAGNKELLAKWKEADTNGDGVLTRGEYLDVVLAKDYNTVKEKLSAMFGGGASTGSSAEANSASVGSTREGKSQ